MSLEYPGQRRRIAAGLSASITTHIALVALSLCVMTDLDGSLAWAQTPAGPPPPPAPDAQPDPTPSPTPDAQPDPTPDAQPDPQPDTKPDVAPDPQPTPTPDAKPDPQPAQPDPAPATTDGSGSDTNPASTGTQPDDTGASATGDAAAMDDVPVEYDMEDAEVIIMTGTADGSEMRKFDASFAITTMSDDDIAISAPKSTADLLKLVPGVWAESSGGVSGANVFVRGFPSGGDAPYLTVQINGAPIFPPPTLSFLENTTLFRIDETVKQVEALRGGPNPVFSNGQPGLTTNFVLREGSKKSEGLVKYTTSSYDLKRLDGYVSGELADRLYYMVGGYISGSPGIRDAGFTADQGHQLTVNLNKDLDNVSINFFHRKTNDHGTWYLPVALNVPGVDASYNQIGVLNRRRSILTNNNGNDPMFAGEPTQRTLDLADGRGWDGSMSGGSVTYFPGGGWTLTDRFGFTSGDADTVGLVPDGGAVRVGDLLDNPDVDARAVVTGPIMGSVTGRAIDPSEYIQAFGVWEVRKDIEAFTNDLSMAKKWGRAKITAGLYSAISSTDEIWALGNSRYEVVQSGGEVVTGIECNDPAVDGCGFNYDIDATGDATTTAMYAAATVDVIDRLTVDLGARAENHDVAYSVDTGIDGGVDFDVRYNESAMSFTAGANYLINKSMAAFTRLNHGSKMPYFDDFRDNQDAYNDGNDLIQTIDQYELGFKWAHDQVQVYATGFFTNVDPTFFVAQAGEGAVIQTQQSMGLELDAIWTNRKGLSISLNGTVQDTEIKSGPNAGNQTQRQPRWQVRLTPSYAFTLRSVAATVYGTLSAVGDRFGEPENVNVLDGYHKLDLGAIVRLSQGFNFQLSADNLTDQDALTESDPRTITAPNGRYIMPRTFKVSLGYQF